MHGRERSAYKTKTRKRVTLPMADSLLLHLLDQWLKPETWYEYSTPILEGFRLIATKDDQKYAGLPASVEAGAAGSTGHRPGFSPIKPYRDYYGRFTLKTPLVPERLEVQFAIGYTWNNRVTTVDDYANFSWLRLATHVEGIVYPNLALQKQLLEYLLGHSRKPRFVTTRVYHFLQNDLYRTITGLIREREWKAAITERT